MKFGLVDFKKLARTNVTGAGAVGGAIVGTAGIGAVRFGLNSIKVGGLPLSTKIPAALQRWMPLLSSLLFAGLGYAAAKKFAPKHANSVAIGSVAAGAVFTATSLIDQLAPALNPGVSDYVTYRLPGMGFVTPSPKSRLNALAGFGILTPNTGKPHLNRLAQAAMDDYVEYDIP